MYLFDQLADSSQGVKYVSFFLCRISESEFMEFSEVENHDDFYSVDEGRVHVQDQRGYYVIYDAAHEDFK